MTVDPLVLSAEVDRATVRVLKSAEALDDAAVAAPSLLPGWSRGHVLTHIARNADSHVNLLTWARTGRETPQYASSAERNAGIADGAARPPAEQVADLRAAHERFTAAVEQMSPQDWSARVRYSSGAEVIAAHVMWARLREVEVHHVDLAVEYRPQDWSDAFTLRLLHEIADNFADTGPSLRLRADDLDFVGALGGAGGSAGVSTVSGPGRALAGWLTGTGFRCGPDGAAGGSVAPGPELEMRNWNVTYTGAVTPGGPADVRELPALTISKLSVGPMDNNAYLLRCRDTGDQLLIDAANDADRVLDLVGDGGLATVATTHRHADHWQALAAVVDATGARSVAHPDDAPEIPVVHETVADGGTVRVGTCALEVIHLVGHTPGSIALLYRDPEGVAHLFTGDSLFPRGSWPDNRSDGLHVPDG